jgi:hypothetical protein
MKHLGIPFTSTRVEEDIRSPLIISLQICPKPTCCITSRRNGHDTESNALEISNLRRILDYFFLIEKPASLLYKHEVI